MKYELRALAVATFLCLLSTSSLAQVGSNVDVPTAVVAGTPVRATILPLNIVNGDTEFVSGLTVYLTVETNALSLHPGFNNQQCYLAKNLSLCDPTITIASDHVSFSNTTFPFSIPSSVGPDAPDYGISFQLFQIDGTKYGSSFGSNFFNLSFATGNWSQTQLAGYILATPDTIPCESFACVKNCSDTYWGMTFVNTPNGTLYGECANNCPGVTLPSGTSTPTTSAQPVVTEYSLVDGKTASVGSLTQAAVCAASSNTSLSLQTGQISTAGGGSTATKTGSASTSTKGSVANRLGAARYLEMFGLPVVLAWVLA